MSASLAEGTTALEQGEAQFEADKAKAFAEAEQEQSAANAEAQRQQQEALAQARADISAEQQSTLQAQSAAVADARGRMAAEQERARARIDARVQADQAAIGAEYRRAQGEADALVADGERQAAAKEAEAKAASEEESWWDRAVSAVQDALNALIDDIMDMWASIREAVSAVLDAAVAFAQELIDAALAFVKDLLNAYYDVIRLLVQELLGDIFPKLAAALVAFIEEARALFLAAFDAIAEALKAAVQALADLLLAALDALIAAMQAVAELYKTLITAILTGDWATLAEMALRAICAVAGIDYDEFIATFGKITEIWDTVLADPMVLIRNGIEALGQGFQQFGENFLKHFLAGGLEWITGAEDIELPDAFSIAALFDVAAQILHLDRAYLLEKVEQHFGEGAATVVEKVMEGLDALLEGGWAGLWEYVKGELGSLVDDILIALGSWLMEKAVLVVGRWIVGLASTFGVSLLFEAVVAAWQFAMWVIDEFASIYGVVKAWVDSIYDFVNGKIDAAANLIEASLADLIPVAIDLCAKLLNLGNTAKKVRSVVEGTREAIDNGIDSAIEAIQGKLGFGGEGSEAGEEEEGGEYDGEIGEVVTFTAAGESHRQYIDASGVAMVASTPMPVKERLADWRKRLDDEPSEVHGQGGPADRERASGLLSSATTALSTVDREVEEAQAADEASKAKQDAEVERAQGTLTRSLSELFAAYQDEVEEAQDPLVTYAREIGVAHPKAQADIEAALTALSEDLPEDKDWAVAKSKLAGHPRIADMTLRVLGSSAYGQHALQEQAIPSARAAKQSACPELELDVPAYVGNRKGQFTSRSGLYKAPADALEEEVWDEGKTSAADAALGTLWTKKLTETKTAHDKYLPQNLKEVRVDKKLVSVSYTGFGDAEFTAEFDEQEMIRSITGTHLTLKGSKGADDVGARGYTGNAGRKTPNQSQHSSHLVPDRLRGSGYKDSANLITTSARFNMNVMAKIEDEICRQYKRCGATSLDLTVTVEWAELTSDAIVEELVDQAAREARIDIEDDEERDELLDACRELLRRYVAANSANLKRVSNCKYSVTYHGANNEDNSLEYETGMDYWLGVE